MAFNSIWGGIARANSPFSVSMESFGLEDDIVNPNTGDVVGDVDTEIAEMATEAAEISADVDSVQSSSTAVDIGETVAEAAQSVQERGDATPEETALIQAGAAQTLAGVGAPTADIVETAQEVASESNGVRTIAIEGFMDKLKSAWQAIKEFVANLIRKTKEFFNRLWNSTAGVLKKVKKLKDKIKDLKDKPENEHVEKWYGYFKLISPSDGSKFDPETSVKKYGEYKNITSKLPEILNGIKAMKDSVSKDSLSKEFNFDSQIGSKIGTSDVSKRLGKDYKGSEEVMPLGNKVFVHGYDSSSSISATAQINSVTARLVDNKDSFDPKPKEPKYKTMSISSIKSLADDVESVVKGLEDWYNKDSKKAYDEIDALRKKVDETVGEINEGDSSTEKDNARVYQRMYVASTQEVRGSIDKCVHIIKVSNAIVSLGFTMADQYEKKDKK